MQSAAAAAAFLLLLFAGTAAESDVVREAADYLLACFDTEEGALTMTPDWLWICPYFQGFAAIGLARAGARTGNASYLNASWVHLGWHQAHMANETPFYITDYDRTSRHDPWVSTGSYDSTDSYAALFMLALGETFRADPDVAKLQGFAKGLERSFVAINSTLDNGLTWATPTWHMKYCMDNSEVYAGLRECGPLADALGMAQVAENCRATAELVRTTAMQQLFSASTGDFLVAVGERPANWSKAYPDALAQLFPPALMLENDDPLSHNLTERFLTLHPEWNASFSFTLAGWALRNIGRAEAAEASGKSLWELAVSDGLSWPFHSADAGQIVGMFVDKVAFGSEESNGGNKDGGSCSASLAFTLSPLTSFSAAAALVAAWL